MFRYPEGSLTYIVSFNLLLKLPPSHMSAVKFKIEVSGGKYHDRVGERIEAKVLQEFIAADMEILPQTIPKLDIVLNLAVVERRPGAGSQGIAGIKIMMKLFKADFPPFGPAHAV